MNFRKLHRKIAPILFLPLLLSALTGMSYRIGRSWFGLSNEFGNLMMTIHEGRYLGKPLVPIYVLLTGLGLIGIVITGISMLKPRKKIDKNNLKPAKFNARLLHSLIAPVFFLPLFVSASTGIIYRLGKEWFGLSAQQAQFFMSIHQGSYLGSSLRAIYILLIGLGLLIMLVTGIQMTGIFRSSTSKSKS
ncbi:MAG: PepSY domain-containing protein [Rivularia sp. (in: cyanobacteria)]